MFIPDGKEAEEAGRRDTASGAAVPTLYRVREAVREIDTTMFARLVRLSDKLDLEEEVKTNPTTSAAEELCRHLSPPDMYMCIRRSVAHPALDSHV